MTQDQFEAILDRRLMAVRNTLSMKAKEYATSADRLHNFKRAAELLRCSPTTACAAMMSKHVVSVMDIVAEESVGIRPTEAQLDEKLGDAVNYLILLEACLKEGSV